MLYRRLLVPLLFLLLITYARGLMAQGGGGNLKVRVVFSDGRPATGQLLVRLMSGASNTPVREIYTNDAGMVEFSQIPSGAYHVIVTGQAIETADSGQFEVDSRKMTQSERRLTLAGQRMHTTWGMNGGVRHWTSATKSRWLGFMTFPRRT